jgi:hypothetical protein
MNHSPSASIARLFASDTIPASATTTTSRRPWASLKAVITGSSVLVVG